MINAREINGIVENALQIQKAEYEVKIKDAYEKGKADVLEALKPMTELKAYEQGRSDAIDDFVELVKEGYSLEDIQRKMRSR